LFKVSIYLGFQQRDFHIQAFPSIENQLMKINMNYQIHLQIQSSPVCHYVLSRKEKLRYSEYENTMRGDELEIETI